MFDFLPKACSASKEDAENLCKKLFDVLYGEGYYPALTGGLLYREGSRKDIDIVIFRNRQTITHFEMENIEDLLIDCGLSEFQYFGFVTKCKFGGLSVDLFNPETKIEFEDGDYTG